LFVYRSSSSIPSYIDHSRSIILFFVLLISFFLTRLLSLLRIFSHSPAFTAQRSNSSNLLRFRGYHRRTEIHATACACFVGPDHDFFGECIGSAFNNVSILPHPTRSLEIQPTSVRHSFRLYYLPPPRCWCPYLPQRPLLHALRLPYRFS
jgi:hypothetical protein